MFLYSLLDKKAAVYGGIMMAQNDAMICRTLEEMCPPTHTVRRYPTDFELYLVGSFDDATARLDDEKCPRFICNMSVVFNKTEA